jgi:hypothetical protein
MDHVSGSFFFANVDERLAWKRQCFIQYFGLRGF